MFSIVQAAPNSTIDQTKLFADADPRRLPVVPGDRRHLPAHVPDRRLRRHGRPSRGASGRKTTQQLLMESMGPLSKIPGVRAIPLTPPPLPGGGDFPVDLVIASAAEPQQLDELAGQLVQKAFASGMFIFADADLKFDQPQAEVVFDRDKLRSQGVDLSQAGRDLSTLLGGDYVNRFSIQGRSYKVIPQVKRAERLTPDQLSQIYITGSDDKLVPLSTFATLRDDGRAARAEEVPAAQRRAHPGRDPAAGAARPGARLPRERGAGDPAAGLHDRLRRRVAPAAHRRQQVPRHVPAVGDPDLPGARGAVRELPRSVHHPGGLGAAGGVRARCCSRSSA